MENKEKNVVENSKENVHFRFKLMINYSKCNHCGMCAKVCDPGVLVMVNNELEVIDATYQCSQCAKCLKACRTHAISLNQSTR